jgi:RimJ/RimL family protein N-acetyltransferase
VAVPPPEGWELLDGRALATERLLLRPLAERDRGWLGALYTRAGDSPDGAGREIDGALVHWREEGFGHYVATLRETGAPAGVIELHRAGAGLTGIEPDEVEIGWVVEPELRGRGLATEGAAALGAHALGALGLDHVVAYIRLENHASARVAETAGLRRRGPGRARNGDPVEVWELRRGGAR